jgi:hypothetical protein
VDDGGVAAHVLAVDLAATRAEIAACPPAHLVEPSGGSGECWLTIARDRATSGFAARSNGRGEPGHPADSLDLRNSPVSFLS